MTFSQNITELRRTQSKLTSIHQSLQGISGHLSKEIVKQKVSMISKLDGCAFRAVEKADYCRKYSTQKSFRKLEKLYH